MAVLFFCVYLDFSSPCAVSAGWSGTALDVVSWTVLGYCHQSSALTHCGSSTQITSVSYICLTLVNTVSGSATGWTLIEENGGKFV